MLPAVLVPGMTDDIYSSCHILQPDLKTGALSKIAVFTENGAIVLTSASCQSLIKKAIKHGAQTHMADQIGGIYVLRKTSTTLATMSKSYSATPPRWFIYRVDAVRSQLTAGGPRTHRPYMSRNCTQRRLDLRRP